MSHDAQLLERIERATVHRVCGSVEESTGQLVVVNGVSAAVGSELIATTRAGRVRLEVVGFRGDRLLAAPLGPVDGLAPGASTRVVRHAASVPAGDALLGRVIDAFGNPLDGGEVPRCTASAPLRAAPPPAFGRIPVTTPLATGVRVIDGLLPIGVGQRMGLFAGAGVGKSTLLGMMVRRAEVDVAVIALVGERGREVGDFVTHVLGDGGLDRSVLVAATSDTPPLVRVRAALSATAIAEHFRERGKRVLLVMDSLTRFAMALREATLAAGEPPLTKGYTPSVFAALPALLERAGSGGPDQGSITALYTVLAEGDDMADPIADAVRGILDGHVVMTRNIAERGIFPAIDVLKSLSRLAPDIAPAPHLAAIASVRALISANAEIEDLVRIGAYVQGTDARVDRARKLMPRIEAFLKQDLREHSTRDAAVDGIFTLASAT